MKTVIEIVQLATEFLHKKGIPHARRQAEELISDALELKRLELYMQHDRPLSEKELDLCRTRLTRRAQGEPSQYIHGYVDFFGCSFHVTPSVLIPRQETEILVDKIAKQLEKCDLHGKTLWDLCCGSGCIGIPLKKKFPMLNVILSDVSSDALTIAKENAQRNEVEVEFRQGDFLSPLAGERVDFLVCNPPYVSEKEFDELDIEVRRYEPRLALVGGVSGLEFYGRLAENLRSVLEVPGKAWLEIGKGQGETIKKLFADGTWSQCEFEKDWGGNDRFFFLEIE